MRIAVLTDVHANLPALEAALKSIHADGCDAVFHTGDAIGIGPYPAECLDLLLGAANTELLMGNHDGYFARGIPDPRPAYMDDGEYEHQLWTHSRLGPELRQVVARWPYVVDREFEGTRIKFLHYALDEPGQEFRAVARNPSAAELDTLFAAGDANLVFYGHHHPHSDAQGKSRYLNPGSLGCCREAVARYYLADFRPGGYTLTHRSVPYDDGPLRQAFAARNVPATEFIARVFFGGRF